MKMNEWNVLKGIYNFCTNVRWSKFTMNLTIYFRWVNNQDFQRASPEPNLHGEPNDLFHKFLQPQNAMHPLQILQPHHLLHKVAQPKPKFYPTPEINPEFYHNPKILPRNFIPTRKFTPKFYPVFSLNCGLHLDLLIKEYLTRTIFQEYHLNWHLLQVSDDLRNDLK